MDTNRRRRRLTVAAPDLREQAVTIVMDALGRPSVCGEGVADGLLAGLTPEMQFGYALGLRMAAEWLEHPDEENHADDVQGLREIAAVAADRYLAEGGA